MATPPPPVVLYYPTGIVHYRNLQIIKKTLPHFRFMVIVEPWVQERAPEVLENIAMEDRVKPHQNRLPDSLWEQKIDILFLSMAYPNPFRLHLVYQAARKNIPVIAIEEVNQLALNDGIINHYFLPIDHLGVPSEVEREKFLELGLAEETVTVTGWPFFDKAAALQVQRQKEIEGEHAIPAHEKICLLVLGSLKEHDIVSLETQKVRSQILSIASQGLLPGYRLLIKPHPVETQKGLEAIRQQVPDAIVVNPKTPIEPLLARADVVVNRGNSQVVLLGMLQQRAVIVIPAGLKTIFHQPPQTPVSFIADSPQDFNKALSFYHNNPKLHTNQLYKDILAQHFPLSQDQALEKMEGLFQKALQKPQPNTRKLFYISLLYAFLGDLPRAQEILNQLPPSQAETVSLFRKLYRHQVTGPQFKELLQIFPEPIVSWHLQALFTRSLTKRKGNKDSQVADIKLLQGFDGDVNPHYFIQDIVKRIHLEFRCGRFDQGQRLLEKFYEAYGIFDFYRQAFDMIRFTYRSRGANRVRQWLWLIKNFNKPYTRRYIKEKFSRT